jgi:hypothetical protein
MAYVAMGGTFVGQGVAGSQFQEGIAVKVSASGLHDDLPTVLPASAGDKNVFIAIVPPDMFPRPTPRGMFNRNQIATSMAAGTLPLSNGGFSVDNAAEYVIDSGQREAQYLLGPSMMSEPTIYSGWAVQLHAGGAYTLTAGAYTDSAAIRVIGATVAVGTGGKFVQSASNVVGWVREYRDGRLTIVLDQRSA